MVPAEPTGESEPTSEPEPTGEPEPTAAPEPSGEPLRDSPNGGAVRRIKLVGVALVIAGALTLFGSLFLIWSHQFSKAVLAQWGSSPVLAGVPRNPTAWQVYSAADVLLAILAVALPIVALAARLRGRLVMLASAGVALAFVIHALNVPPTNHATFFEAAVRVPTTPIAGSGEGLAIAALGAAIVGLLLTLGAPRPGLR